MATEHALRELEERIQECMRKSPNLKQFASVSDVEGKFCLFYDAWAPPAGQPKGMSAEDWKKKHEEWEKFDSEFLNNLCRFADKSTYDTYDAGMALYILRAGLSAGIATKDAQANEWIDPTYNPIKDILQLSKQLPVRVALYEGFRRSMYLAHARAMCSDAPGRQGLENPPEVLAQILNTI